MRSGGHRLLASTLLRPSRPDSTAIASLHVHPKRVYSSSASTTSSRTMTAITYSGSVAKIPTGSSAAASAPETATSFPHHLTRNGSVVGFKNPHDSCGNIKPFQIFKHFMWPWITGQISRPKTNPPSVPVVKPTFVADRLGSSQLRATWLGHACYYVEFPSGLRVLFDPVFEDRCSPFSFIGPSRFTRPPCALSDIPTLDAVLISHSHYDHLSHKSVLELQRLHPRVHFFVGRGLEAWFRAAGLRKVTELDWWDEANLELELEVDGGDRDGASEEAGAAVPPRRISARISCTPSQHTSARTAFDRDTTLWCSWAVRSGGRSVWFGGDTGYRAVPVLPAGTDDYGPDFAHLPRCPDFADIGTHRGPFELGLIPIGAYAPRAAFSSMHADPFDAVEIFRDTRCARAMGIHWGTWVLTFEDVVEPPKLLREAMRRAGLDEVGVFDVCDIGETREF